MSAPTAATRVTSLDPVPIRPYAWHGPFAYSLRCVLCRHECEHSEEQHYILSNGFRLVPR